MPFIKPVVRGIAFTPYGYKKFIVEPEHPLYTEMKERNDKAGRVLDRCDFDKTLRGFWKMFVIGP